jgi:hypothetical protein
MQGHQDRALPRFERRQLPVRRLPHLGGLTFEVGERSVASRLDVGHRIRRGRVLGEQLVLAAAALDDLGVELCAGRGQAGQCWRSVAVAGASAGSAGRCGHPAVLSRRGRPARNGSTPAPVHSQRGFAVFPLARPTCLTALETAPGGRDGVHEADAPAADRSPPGARPAGEVYR